SVHRQTGKDNRMRLRLIAPHIGLVVVLGGFVATAADDAKPFTVELKAFTFKVPEGMADLFGHNEDEQKLFFYTNGTAEAKVKVPEDGNDPIVATASGDKAMNAGGKFKVAVDGKPVGKETETTDEMKEYRFPMTLKAGERKLTIEFTNDVYKEGEYDRNLYVHEVVLKKGK